MITEEQRPATAKALPTHLSLTGTRALSSSGSQVLEDIRKVVP